MKKQLTKLFGRRKTGEDGETSADSSPVKSLAPPTPFSGSVVVVPSDARYARITTHMKDVALVCKLFVGNMKKDNGGASNDVSKLASTINAIALKIQSTLGEGSTAGSGAQAYCTSELGVALSDQTGLPALLVEVLDRIRLFYLVQHIKELETSAESVDPGLEHCVATLGQCLVGVFANAVVVDRYRCELVNLMRMAADLFAPCTLFVRAAVEATLSNTVATTFNAGLVWYLHDAGAVAVVVKTMRELVDAPHVTSHNASTAVGSFHMVPSATDELHVHEAVSKALGLHKDEKAPTDEVRPPECTFTLSSHDPFVGTTRLVQLLQASARFSWVLIQDFAAAGGYDVVWLLVAQDAANGMDVFLSLLPLGDGVDKTTTDWTMKKCGAWNEAAFVALRDFLFQRIHDSAAHGHGSDDGDNNNGAVDALAPYYNVMAQVYMRAEVDNFKRLEAKTLLLTSLVSKIRELPPVAQAIVLACVEHVGVKAPTLEVTRDILSMLCALFMEAKDQHDRAISMLLCDSLTKMLQQMPSSDHPLRDTLLEFGLLDRAIYPYFQSLPYDAATTLRPHVQGLCTLTCHVLHNHVAGCTRFRDLQVHVTVHRVAKEWIEDADAFASLFQIFVELAGVTKSALLLQGIEEDVRMLLGLVQHCRELDAPLGLLLTLLQQYLGNNVTAQRIWRDASGMERLLSTISSLDDHARHVGHVKTMFDIFHLLLESAETRTYAVEHHMYHTLADCLVATGWLGSIESAVVIEHILGLVFKGTKKYVVQNADAMAMLFELWPHMTPDQQTKLVGDLLHRLTQLMKPNEQKAALVHAGIFGWIHPLIATSPSLMALMQCLSTNQIPIPHLRDFLRVLYQTPGRGLQFLDTMTKAPLVPHACLQHHAYIHVTTDKLWPPPSGYAFACWFQFPPDVTMPSHTVTVPMCEGYLHMDHGLGSKYAVLVGSALSVYESKEAALQPATKELVVLDIHEYAEEGADAFRICTTDTDEWYAARVVDVDQAPAWKKALTVYSKPYVMLIALYAMDQPQCFTRVYFDPATTCLRVETSAKHHVLFKNIDIGLFAERSWHHLVLTHRRAVVGSSLVTLFIDGAEICTKKLSYPASTSPSPIRSFLGSDPHLFPSTCIRSICLGPMWLMSDVLPPLAATVMFMMGPTYMYSFPGNTSSQGAIDEWTESALTSFLHWIIHRKVDVARAAQRLELMKLGLAAQKNWQQEMVVSQMDEEDKDIWTSIWFRFFVDRYCSIKLLGEEWLSAVASFKWPEENILWSLHTEVPNAQTYVQYIDTEPTIPLDLPKVIPSLGGPRTVLIPLAETVDNASDLRLFLRVLTRCLKTNPATMAWFIEHGGHPWLVGFLLHRIDMVDESILVAVAKLAISGTLNEAKQGQPETKVAHPVIVNTHAVNHILLSAAFRHKLSWALQHKLVVVLGYTIHPHNPNAVFNARQLRQSHVTVWWLQYIAHLCRTDQANPLLVDQLMAFLTRLLHVELHVDDLLHVSDMLLSALMDPHKRLRHTLLASLATHVETSPVVARTLIDSIFYRLHQDRKRGVAVYPSWCTLTPLPIKFSIDGFEHVLLEVIARAASVDATMPSDAYLATRLLFSLVQLQPAFAMHLLVNSSLHIRLKQVLSLHSLHVVPFVPLLAFALLIPISQVNHEANKLALAFPTKYTPTAMDRECIDAVWDILGHLWKLNQTTNPSDPTTLEVLTWLDARLTLDTLVFQAVCRSSSAFLAMLLRCIDPSKGRTTTSTIHDAAARCLATFLAQSLVERDDWADNVLFCLHLWHDNQPQWLVLVQTIVDETRVLTDQGSLVAMKNICSLFLGLVRLLATKRKPRDEKLKNVPFVWNVVDLHEPTVGFVCDVIAKCGDKHLAGALGDEAQQYFYGVLVFCAQALVLHGLYPVQQRATAWQFDVLGRVAAAKHLFLQQTNVSSILMYSSASPNPVDMYAHASGFRLHMRQMSLHGNQKEFVLGQESDKLFVLCLATTLVRMLLIDDTATCFAPIELWQFLLQQRMGMLKELLIIEPKASLLTTISAAKKESVDVFHNGFDQVLTIDALDHAQLPVFTTWLQCQRLLLQDVFPARTDPMFQMLVETSEGSLLLRHPKQCDWVVRVAVDLPCGYPSLEWSAVETPIEGQLQQASEKASLRFDHGLSSQVESVDEATTAWARERQKAKYARSLWEEPLAMRVRPNQSVYQTSWASAALDATEGPGRKRMRLKWNEVLLANDQEKTVVVAATGKPAAGGIQRCLEFHDMVEVYRQCMYKQEMDLSQCKFPQTRESLRDVAKTAAAIAETIARLFLHQDQYQDLGISSVVAQDIDAMLVRSKEDIEFVRVLPNTLFDVADSEAMQRALLKPNALKLTLDQPGNHDPHDSDEEYSDDEDEVHTRGSISGRRSDTLLDDAPPQIANASADDSKPKETHAATDQMYGGLLRFLHRNDKPPHHACNAMSISGMHKSTGVYLMCAESIYFVEGYVVVDDTQTPAKGVVDFHEMHGRVAIKPSPSATSYQLQWRLKYHDIKQFYRIKYQLRPVGLELVDVGGWTYFCTFESARGREDIFKTLFQMPIHNSIYWAHVLRPAPFRSMKRLRQTLTKKWLRGSLSNFEYLIELNALAGRTFNDVTQYPVFPWVLADYTSETLDLTKDETYRDLSKPMGALGAKRAEQFKERYLAMSTDGFDGSPAFHYGTHYSCSAYVTYYLLRLEPFSTMAQELQGGDFDKADRLFRNIGASWSSASAENLQDVRELIPEFYFLPEFLVNANGFDLGSTQSGDVVNDVILPPWARQDPREFIRLHRRALESKYVSENLHSWIDLVFGYKQRGQEAVDSLNVFMHMTYEGTVDIDAITDPLLREATLAQIENFGQTPSKLFNSPHPPRKVPQLHAQSLSTLLTHASDLNMNAQSSVEAYLKWHTPLAPPLVSIGKEYVHLKKAHMVQVMEEAIGDVKAVSDKYVCKGQSCALTPPRMKKFVDWGLGNGSLALRSIKSKSLLVIENVHTRAIRCGAFSDDGMILVTGGDDAVVNVLECAKVHGERSFIHKGKLTGHNDSVTCVAINKAFNVVVSGSNDHSAIVWDLRTRRYLRELRGHDAPLRHVGINGANGNILTVAHSQVRLWSVNGDLLAAALLPTLGLGPVTAALCTSCDTWQNGVVVLTGHSNGTIACWGLTYPLDMDASTSSDAVLISSTDKALPSCRLYVMKLLLEHRAAVTALAVTPDHRQLISGDADGWCIRWVDDSASATAAT
ncbi:Aste57867_16541 [Aphanomyces stellatus]|uniref:Aste57867_16541 protein n=1 Tax=Aphanomyces stellatus TaxID=120398 RepID=A0A485L5P1_9STRA|nr:hypothetical protein As57867_016484 [Aphanomyces stellatus]VFT93315.1 Aste57867_16541 [Aphanomyces stellatus]